MNAVFFSASSKQRERQTMRKLVFALTAVLCLCAAAASAATTGTLSVSATLVNSCSVTSGSLNFGSALTYSTPLAQTDQTGTFDVTCTTLAAYTIDLDNGQNALVTQRRLKHATADFLSYNLFQDSLRAVPWGAGVDAKIGQIGTGSAQTNSVFGRLLAQTPTSTGAYSDTVGIT